MIFLSRRISLRRISPLFPMLFLALLPVTLLSSQSTNSSTPSSYQEEDFGHYLAEHQQALKPLMDKYAPEWSQALIPLLFQMELPSVIVSLVIIFLLNLVLGRLYAGIFAPAQATLRHSFYFALCNLMQLTLGTSLSLGLLYLGLQNFGNPQLLLICSLLAALIALGCIIFSVVLIIYFYRTGLGSALGLYLIFAVAGVIISMPANLIVLPRYVKISAPKNIADFLDQKVSPKILLEAEASKTAYATALQARFNIQKQIDENQAKVAQIQARTDDLQKKINDWLQSDAYALSQIGPIRAKGDLIQAQKAYQDFLTRFPTSSFNDSVKAQLAEVTADYAAEQQAEKDAAVRAAQDAATYQANLLQRVKTSGASLSELHQFLLGKTREQVRQLFGSPTETASDRWGYSQIITLNQMTNQKYGLAITFEQGVVQSLDYYYGGGQRLPTSTPAAHPTENSQ